MQNETAREVERDSVESVKDSIIKTFEVIDSDVRKLTELTKPQSRSEWESRGRRPGR